MPIYEYQCQDCGEGLEALQKLSDAPLVDCPACHKPSLKKKVSAAAFRLKGGGWYETDFKTGDKKNLAGGGEGAGKAEAGSGDASGSKTDTAKSSGGNSGGSDSGSSNSSNPPAA